MPSIFPGMDPFIENQRWEGFHTRFITQTCDVLVEKLRPRYDVDVEMRVYLEQRDLGHHSRKFVADVGLIDSHPDAGPGGVSLVRESAIEPTECILPWPEEHREAYVVFRRPHHGEVITVLELLSPTNKRRQSNGREVYLAKRMELIQTRAHLVELDLLRGGDRMPFSNPPEGDYFALVSRVKRRPVASVYGWPLKHRMPVIPIPLADGEPDVELDLQAVFNTVFDRAGYDYNLDYGLDVAPPFSDAEKQWVTELLSNRQA